MTHLLFNPDEGRLRAGWRLALQSGLLLGLTVLLLIFLVPVIFAGFLIDADILSRISTAVGAPAELVLGLPVEIVAITLSVYLARRFADRRSFASLGLWWNGRARRDLAAGFLFAGLMIGLIFLIEVLGGWLTIEAYAFNQTSPGRIIFQTLALLTGFMIVGWSEELLFRGYWLQNLWEGLNLVLGVLISSILFSLAHIGNPGFSPEAFVGLFLAGLFFAYSLLRSGNLWLPVGLHIGWNFFEGPVFGFQVSGLEAFRLVEHSVQGPDLLVGGAFGPEAGLVLLPALGLGILLIHLYTHKREPAVLPLPERPRTAPERPDS